MNKIKKFLKNDEKMKNIEAIYWFNVIINHTVKKQESRSSFLEFYYWVLQPLLYLNYKYLFNSIGNISALRNLLFFIILRKKYKIQIEDYLENNVDPDIKNKEIRSYVEQSLWQEYNLENKCEIDLESTKKMVEGITKLKSIDNVKINEFINEINNFNNQNNTESKNFLKETFILFLLNHPYQTMTEQEQKEYSETGDAKELIAQFIKGINNKSKVFNKDIELIRELSNRNYDVSKTDLVNTIYYYIDYILEYIFSIYYIQKYVVPQQKHKFIFLRPTILILGTLIEYVTIRIAKGKWYSFLRTDENKRFFHFTKKDVNASSFDKSYFFTAIVIEPVVTYYLVKAYSKWIKS